MISVRTGLSKKWKFCRKPPKSGGKSLLHSRSISFLTEQRVEILTLMPRNIGNGDDCKIMTSVSLIGQEYGILPQDSFFSWHWPSSTAEWWLMVMNGQIEGFTSNKTACFESQWTHKPVIQLFLTKLFILRPRAPFPPSYRKGSHPEYLLLLQGCPILRSSEPKP